MMKNRLDDRTRLFLGGGYLRYQKPEVAREAIECAHAIRDGKFDARRIRKALWALDLSMEPTAFLERTAIFKAMRGQAFILDHERGLIEIEIETRRTPYDGIVSNPERIGGFDAYVRAYVRKVGIKISPEAVKSLRRAAKTHSFDPSMLIGKVLPEQTVFAALAGDWIGTKRISMPVGSGKTDISILAPLYVKDCKVAIRFVEPSELETYAQHYGKLKDAGENLPSCILRGKGFIVSGAPVLHVFSKMTLSKPENADLLNRINPDLIIIDERAFPLAAARRNRIESYTDDHGLCPRIVAWT